jgi:ActR/RegA family two-component response regulator
VSRVAVVHPRQAVRSLASHILLANGFAPIEAETVADAMALIETDPPALAVVDERLVAELPRLPIPWVAIGRRGARTLLMGAGAACMIEKPFSVADLRRAVLWTIAVYPTP